MCVCVCVCMCVYVSVCVCVCVCIYIYIYIHTCVCAYVCVIHDASRREDMYYNGGVAPHVCKFRATKIYKDAHKPLARPD